MMTTGGRIGVGPITVVTGVLSGMEFMASAAKLDTGYRHYLLFSRT